MELPFYDDNKKDVEVNVVKLKYKPMIYIYIYFVKKLMFWAREIEEKMLFNFNFFCNLYHS